MPFYDINITEIEKDFCERTTYLAARQQPTVKPG